MMMISGLRGTIRGTCILHRARGGVLFDLQREGLHHETRITLGDVVARVRLHELQKQLGNLYKYQSDRQTESLHKWKTSVKHVVRRVGAVENFEANLFELGIEVNLHRQGSSIFKVNYD